MAPVIIHEKDSARLWVKERRSGGRTVGLVPTMGALHEGHISLMRRSKSECDYTAISIFVNPTQFGPDEDYEQYPRNLERDATLAESAGVDMIFAPSPATMYPEGTYTWVDVEKLTERLCGAHRPGHFRGVTTVVTKLFHVIPADVAYFGQKDFQQAIVIRRMVRDLDFDITVRICPTVRETDGLAMSSRNAYLNPDERAQALCLYRALRRAREMFHTGERDSRKIRAEMENIVKSGAPGSTIDYIEIVEPDGLTAPEEINGRCVAALAVRVGTTRLIDNMQLGTATGAFEPD